MKNNFFGWAENYIYSPTLFDKILSALLLPLSAIYCLLIKNKRLSAKPVDYAIKIVSVGNLIAGGSGKTPLTIALAKDKKNCAIILRGYGRKTKGLFTVSHNGTVKIDVNASGDEAMLLAKSLPNATVIVSEDRIEAIKKAKSLGAKIIFMDDGFSKVNIKKIDILIEPEIKPANNLCLPSGGYREPISHYKYADLLIKENIDFDRKIDFFLISHKEREPIDRARLKEFEKDGIMIVTSISKPRRLYKYLSSNYQTLSFADHSYFDNELIIKEVKKHNIKYLLVTSKDLVKLTIAHSLDIKIILMDLQIVLNEDTKTKINSLI
jgi:tetraacyldisaccharide 4'-kinase